MSDDVLTFGSLFAGIGGFDLGFERDGMKCLWQVEIDDYCQRVLAKHWPDVERFRDVKECGSHNLRPVDVICGGFPCQDISYAGRRAGLDGSRSGLFFEAVRVVCELRPRVVVLENVAALLDGGLDRVLGTLAEVGFDAEWDCVPASAFGCPSWQENVFIVAYPSGERCPQPGNDRKVCVYGSQDGKWKTTHAVDAIRRGSVPGVCREHRRVSHRMDRLRGLGNAVVPQVTEWIGRRIVEGLRGWAGE